MENTNLRGPGGPQQPGQPQMPPPPQMSPAEAAQSKKGKKEKPAKQPKEKKPRAPKAPKEPGAGGKKSQIILLVVLLVVAAAAAAYMFMSNSNGGGNKPPPRPGTMTKRNTVPTPPGVNPGVPVPPGAQAQGEKPGAGTPPPPPPGANKATPPPPKTTADKNPSLITGDELNAKSKKTAVPKPARTAAAPASTERIAPPAPAPKKKKKTATPSVSIAENPQETYKPKTLSYGTAKRAKRSYTRKASHKSPSYAYYAPAPSRKNSAPVYHETGRPASEFRAVPGNLPVRAMGYTPPPIASPGSARGVELYTWEPSRRGGAYISPEEFNGPGRPSAPGGGLSRVHEYHRVVVLEGSDYYKVQQAKERLAHRNLIPEVRSFEAGGDTYYEVSIGHYTDKNMALNKANEIAAEGYSPRVVTEKIYQ